MIFPELLSFIAEADETSRAHWRSIPGASPTKVPVDSLIKVTNPNATPLIDLQVLNAVAKQQLLLQFAVEAIDLRVEFVAAVL